MIPAPNSTKVGWLSDSGVFLGGSITTSAKANTEANVKKSEAMSFFMLCSWIGGLKTDWKLRFIASTTITDIK